MKTTQILIAGFGGQGILFAGKFLAYKGLLEDLQVSWLPSYGPEMRGGTANCNVILSEEPVGSPIVEAGVPTLANMVMMGHVLRHNRSLSFEGTEATVQKLVPPKKAELVGLNMKALEAGRDYQG